MQNPDRPLSELPYDTVHRLEQQLAALESQALARLLTISQRPHPFLERTPEWIDWQSACHSHNELLDELDRREIAYPDA